MKQLLYIGNNLKSKKANTTFMSTLGPLLANEGYALRYASSKTSKVARLLDMMFSVLRYGSRTDIVLIDTYGTQNFYYALLVSQLCRLMRLPYIAILHGGTLPLRLKHSPQMSHLIFRHSKHNVAPSRYFQRVFEGHGYTNIRYIPNTIEIKNYVYVQRTYVAPRLLWVRSFSELYNPTMAVKVLKYLKDTGVDATLCMVGPDSDGSLEQVKQLAQELHLEVRFTGKLTKKDWVTLSEDYNVFINTSNVDNTPISVIEAMALGLPVVSTNVGGLPYLIEDCIQGTLVEKNDSDAMAQAILALFENPVERDFMVCNARRLAETFDWERVKLGWERVLE